MRIIAGTHRGRPILGPKDAATTRPITDRVKTSLFDRLAAAGRLENAVVLDLFSGTGSMGLECLSRGAEHVTFVERDKTALSRLQQNLSNLRHTHQATVITHDALGLSVIDAGRRRPFTLVFCDPPYRMMEQDRDRHRVQTQMARLAEVTADETVMVLRTPARVPAPELEAWSGPTSYSYGSMTLHFYDKHAQTEASASAD